MVYIPKPIDTSSIKLNEELNETLELLAHNSHEIWAEKRISEGWTLGATRNDIKKQHPGLIPYNLLPESEKEYDRNAVNETLKALIALGHKIDL